MVRVRPFQNLAFGRITVVTIAAFQLEHRHWFYLLLYVNDASTTKDPVGARHAPKQSDRSS